MKRFYSILQTSVSAAALSCIAGTAAAVDVSTAEELANALADGSDVTLIADVTLTENLPSANSGSFTVDGNSKMLSGGGFGGFVVGGAAEVNFENLNVSDFNQVLSNNGATIGHISNSTFVNNKASVASGNVLGGAILNTGTIGEISDSKFSGNAAISENGMAYGGAIAHTGDELTIINTDFLNNYAQSGGVSVGEEGEAANPAYGGAIYSTGTLNIIAKGKDVLFSGNYVSEPTVEENGGGEEGGGEEGDNGDIDDKSINPRADDGGDGEGEDTEPPAPTITNNAIAMNGGRLNLKTEGGNIIFDDEISSVDREYNLSVRGNGEVIFNNSVRGVSNFVFDNSFLTLGAAGNLYVRNYTAVGTPVLTVTVNPDTLVASQIYAENDIVGTTKVIVKTTSDKIIGTDQSILFVSAEGDNKETAADFVVYRVYGSPYMWKSEYKEVQAPDDENGGDEEGGDNGDVGDKSVGTTADGEGEAGGEAGGENGVSTNGWYLSMTRDSNPDFRPMAPEIAAFLSLHSAAAEQNRGVVTSIRNSVAANKFLLKRYDVLYEDHYKRRPVSNLWANPVYRYAKVSAPQEWDANIAGFDMGLDLQNDASNKIGAFGSYRYGTYDISEEGFFRADMGSEIEISSFLLGMYYRYDYNNFWTFATAYAGRQHAEIETDDHVKAKADAMQYGAGVEMGYAFIPGYNWTLEPSLGVFYTGIDYDDMKDEYGKSAEYSMLNQVEGEFGVKLEKTFDHDYGYTKLYVKPSVVQTLNFGNEVKITHLGKVDSLDDQTLGRIEVGGRVALDSKMSLFGYVNYTTGSDYDDIAAALGFSYRWY